MREPKKVYIASVFTGNPTNKKIVDALAAAMDDAGYKCIQTWTRPAKETASGEARRDLTQIEEADIVVALAEGCEDYPNSGMHFEAGFGLALGKTIILIGPILNIFYKLPGVVRFQNLSDFIRFLSKGNLAMAV